MRRYIPTSLLAAAALLFLTGTATAAPAPSHPLSHIDPIDTDLNFTNNPNQRAYNITSLPWINPFGTTLTVGSTLRLNDNLDANGNNIQGLNQIQNFFGSACGPGEVVDQINPDGSYQCESVSTDFGDNWVNESGDAMTGNLDLQGNNLSCGYINGVDCNALSSAATADNLSKTLAAGNSAGPYNLNMNGNQILNLGNVTIVADMGLTGGQIGVGTTTPASQLDVNGTADIRGDLDMNTNNIRNINRLSGFFNSACPSGKVVNRVFNDGSYSCVDASSLINDNWVNQSGDTMTGTLNMSGNNITDIGSLKSFFQGACGAGEFVDQIYDNGTVSCQSTTSTTENLSETLAAGNSAGSYNIDLNGNILDNVGNIRGRNDQNIIVDLAGAANNRFTVYDNAAPKQVLNVYQDGQVEIPNGALNMSGNNISQINNVLTAGQTITVRDSTNGQDVTRFTEGGDVVVPSGDIRVQGNKVTYQDGTLAAFSMLDTGNDWVLETGGGTDILTAHAANQSIRVTNGNLNLNNNNLTNIDSLVGFFGAACNANEAVAEIYDNGTVRCIDTVTDETTEAGLPRTLAINNTANMTIRMDGNNLALEGGYLSNDGQNEGVSVDNQGNVGVGTGNPDSKLDVDGSTNMSSSGTNMEVRQNGDVVITLGS